MYEDAHLEAAYEDRFDFEYGSNEADVVFHDDDEYPFQAERLNGSGWAPDDEW